jgi:hypothetical protein
MLEPGVVARSPRGTVIEILENTPDVAQRASAAALAKVASARAIRPVV